VHRTDNLAFLESDVVAAARQLLGCTIIRTINGRTLKGRIVETEAYHQSDAASHSYKGRTARTAVMFGPPGFLYVYFTYGMHYCMNVVTGPEGEGSAVLIRALEPMAGMDEMRSNRGVVTDLQLTNGPAKLCQALQVNALLNGHDLRRPPIRLEAGLRADYAIIQTTRIGISQAKEQPWRFYIADNPYVSRK